MGEHANTFLVITVLVLVTVLLIFGMRAFAAVWQARMRATGEGAYRELAERAVSLQSAGTNAMTAVQAELSEIKARLAAVEKLLREVA